MNFFTLSNLTWFLSSCMQMVITPGDRYLVTASEDGSLFIWTITDNLGRLLCLKEMKYTDEVLCSKSYLEQKVNMNSYWSVILMKVMELLLSCPWLGCMFLTYFCVQTLGKEFTRGYHPGGKAGVWAGASAESEGQDLHAEAQWTRVEIPQADWGSESPKWGQILSSSTRSFSCEAFNIKLSLILMYPWIKGIRWVQINITYW